MAGMMALLSSPPPTMALLQKQPSALRPFPSAAIRTKRAAARRLGACAFCNPFGDQPIIKDALKEPVAFMGGVFAGLLRLDLNEEPLKEWIARNVEDSGMAVETKIDSEAAARVGREGEPWEIEIE